MEYRKISEVQSEDPGVDGGKKTSDRTWLEHLYDCFVYTIVTAMLVLTGSYCLSYNELLYSGRRLTTTVRVGAPFVHQANYYEGRELANPFRQDFDPGKFGLNCACILLPVGVVAALWELCFRRTGRVVVCLSGVVMILLVSATAFSFWTPYGITWFHRETEFHDDLMTIGAMEPSRQAISFWGSTVCERFATDDDQF